MTKVCDAKWREVKAQRAAWLLLVRDEPSFRADRVDPENLTRREREVLEWVAAGKSDRQIAAIVGTSPRTVQKHLEHIYVRLGVENRTAAAMRVRAGNGGNATARTA